MVVIKVVIGGEFSVNVKTLDCVEVGTFLMVM